MVQLTISVSFALSILSASPDNRQMNACLGKYENHFNDPRGNQVCTHGGIIREGFCTVGIILHTILASNVPETILLFFCFRVIRTQTEKAESMIGKESYRIRKR